MVNIEQVPDGWWCPIIATFYWVITSQLNLVMQFKLMTSYVFSNVE